MFTVKCAINYQSIKTPQNHYMIVNQHSPAMDCSCCSTSSMLDLSSGLKLIITLTNPFNCVIWCVSLILNLTGGLVNPCVICIILPNGKKLTGKVNLSFCIIKIKHSI